MQKSNRQEQEGWLIGFCILAIMKQPLLIALFLASAFFTVAQSPKNITVKIDQHKADIKSTMWGIFFEDINLAADGGIYAELVKNRSFEFTTPMMGWKEQRKGVVGGSLWVLNRGTANQNNPRYIRVQNALSGNYGITFTLSKGVRN